MINIDVLGTDLNINPVLLIIGLVISICIYTYCFIKSNPYADFKQYFYALMNFFTLCVLTIFLIVGYFITIFLLESKQYVGLLIPIGWFYICYVKIKRIVAQDFQISIGNIININWNKWEPIGILISLSAGLSFATFSIFSVIPDTANQPYGPFPLIIAGIIFLLFTIVIFIQTYRTITGKAQYIRIGRSSFSSLSNQNLLSPDASENEIKDAIKADKHSIRIFLILWGVIACLFAAIFIYCYLIDKGVISH